MILTIFSWWILSTLAGLFAMPIAYRLFNRLPGRGFAMSRILGILLGGYVYWLGASLQILSAGAGGAVAGLAVLLALGLMAGKGHWEEIWGWLQAKGRMVLAMEGLFLLAFMFWSFVRINNPEIAFTEKPMELAFINGILRSEQFPPQDPWLSGYAISYYYFGYVLIAFLTHLTGVTAGEAFNLGNALWFAFSVVGTYSITYNLLVLRKGRSSLSLPLFGPLFVLISGNLEVLFEILHHRHFFWQGLGGAAPTSRFWSWLGIARLAEPPGSAATWMPDRFLWWWQASRVIGDVDLAGQHVEVIDEFPFFTFLLADNHPHLLALPIVLLAVLFALQVFLSPFEGGVRLAKLKIPPDRLRKVIKWLGGALLLLLLLKGIAGLGAGESVQSLLPDLLFTALKWAAIAVLLSVFAGILSGQFESALPSDLFWPAALIFGSLAFLNTWDLPIYLSLLLLVVAWKQRKLPPGKLILNLAATGYALLLTGVLFFLPWYPSFQSQAGGILPNLISPTRFVHFLTMFGPLLIPILFWLLLQVSRGWEKRERRTLFLITIGVPLMLLLLSWLLGIAAYGILQGDPATLQGAIGGLGLSGSGDQAVADLLAGIVARRSQHSWTALLLGFILAVIVLGLLRVIRARRRDEVDLQPSDPRLFVFAMIGIGALLILGPEFLYLRDTFGTRMNTIFKFYFAAWILWGLAAAYIAGSLWPETLSGRALLRQSILLPLLIGLLYPVLALSTKTEMFNPSAGRALDGTVYLQRSSPSDYAAVLWMNDHLEPGIVAEAVDGSYSTGARIATHTGFSTVLGWPGHELQWRGGYEEQGSRGDDIKRLYLGQDWMEAKAISDEYGIQYIYVGPLERNLYSRVEEGKFLYFMDVVYNEGDVVIYARPGAIDQ